MPMLPLEPFVFPETLLAPLAGFPLSGQWWVLHTRPRAEKALVWSFWRRGIAFFLPQQKRQVRTRVRTLTSYMPLFPGYHQGVSVEIDP